VDNCDSRRSSLVMPINRADTARIRRSRFRKLASAKLAAEAITVIAHGEGRGHAVAASRDKSTASARNPATFNAGSRFTDTRVPHAAEASPEN